MIFQRAQPIRPETQPARGSTDVGTASLAGGELEPGEAVGARAGHPPIRAVGEGSRSLSQRAVLGAGWAFLGLGAYRIVSFLTNLILARLLSPTDFGLVAFAMIIINAFTLLQDLGVGPAIIYSGREPRAVAGTSLTINVLAATLLLAVTVLVSPILAALGGDAAIGPIASVLAVGLLITSAGSVQNALLMRDLAFRRKLVPDIAPVVASAATSVACALLGFGAWSLVYGYLAKSIASTALFWAASAIRPRPELRWSIAAELLRYGRHVSAASVIGFVVMNVDYFIVGNALGPHELGIYSLAFIIASLPSNTIGLAIAQATFPAYSRIRDDAELLNALFARIFSVLTSISFAAGIAILLFAEIGTTVGLGEQWAGLVAPLQILAVFGALRTIEWVFAPVFRAIGRPSVVWKLSLLRLVVLTPLLLVAVRYGVVGVSVVQVAVVAVFVPLNAVVIARLIDFPLRQLWSLALPPIAAAAVAGGLVLTARSVPALQTATAGLAGSCLLGAVTLLAFLGVLFALNPQLFALGRSTLALITRGSNGHRPA
ncbi:MAG: oligosaccharide flippase family protein [Chloroflexi bacterium]|nr:oligosaccharide flippase family protein [Chloroflexota bacterium]